jgi:hypothetical protein
VVVREGWRVCVVEEEDMYVLSNHVFWWIRLPSEVVLHTSPGLEMRNSMDSSFLPRSFTISARA